MGRAAKDEVEAVFATEQPLHDHLCFVGTRIGGNMREGDAIDRRLFAMLVGFGVLIQVDRHTHGEKGLADGVGGLRVGFDADAEMQTSRQQRTRDRIACGMRGRQESGGFAMASLAGEQHGGDALRQGMLLCAGPLQMSCGDGATGLG